MKFPGNILLKTARNVRVINGSFDSSMKDLNDAIAIPQTISLKTFRVGSKFIHNDPHLLCELFLLGKSNLIEYLFHLFVLKLKT
jgi:hypothetical protein